MPPGVLTVSVGLDISWKRFLLGVRWTSLVRALARQILFVEGRTLAVFDVDLTLRANSSRDSPVSDSESDTNERRDRRDDGARVVRMEA